MRSLVTFIENITPEKRIEQVFKTTEQMAQIGGWEYDPYSDDLYWTDQVYRIHEVPLDKKVSLEGALDFYLPEDKKRIKQLFEDCLENHTSFDEEFQVKTGNGNNKWVRAMGRPIMRNGKLFKLVGVFADINDVKKQTNELKKNAEEKRVLLAEIHHRVKNNLAIISGLLELKSMDAKNDELKDAMRQSQLRIQSMAKIHEALYKAQDFSNLKFSVFIQDLVDVIEDAHKGMNKKISVSINCDDSLKLNINQAIPTGLIINELVTNSFQHAFDNQDIGSINITFDETANRLRLVISDNGKGLTEDAFEKQSNSLGATLIKQLTKQLDGELNIQNKNGAFIELLFPENKHAGSSSNNFEYK